MDGIAAIGNVNLIGGIITTIFIFCLWGDRARVFAALAAVERAPKWVVTPVAILLAGSSVDALSTGPRNIFGNPFSFVGGLVSNVTLWIHEGGHFYCSFFGEWPMFAGGTALELLVPAGCAAICARRRLWRCALAGVHWFGFELIGTGRYIADARARKLELLGGEGGRHDWEYLLGSVGLTAYDTALGGAVLVAGFLVSVAAAGLLAVMSRYDTEVRAAAGRASATIASKARGLMARAPKRTTVGR